MYKHWSFGKHFVREEKMYSKGYTGLAYEIVINSNPCISYNLEDNTMAMQTLVMAHAAFGHNHFFKNNNVFRQWTDAEGILDYLQFAKSYVSQCEDKTRARRGRGGARFSPCHHGPRCVSLSAAAEAELARSN